MTDREKLAKIDEEIEAIREDRSKTNRLKQLVVERSVLKKKALEQQGVSTAKVTAEDQPTKELPKRKKGASQLNSNAKTTSLGGPKR